MKKTKTKVLSFALSILTMYTMMPTNVFAEESSTNDVAINPKEGEVVINAENFPDNDFRKFIKENSSINKDFNEILSLDEINNVNEINIDDWNSIESLKGIEHFKNLTKLSCYYGNLTTLDLSENTNLVTLNCANNKLKVLNISGINTLTNLDCSNNKLESLILRDNTNLEILNCERNQISELDLGNHIKLIELSCGNNKLTSLDISKNTALSKLSCGNNAFLSASYSRNEFKSLDISKNTLLIEVNCSYSKLGNLDVSNNPKLTKLDCSRNQFKSLDVSKNTALSTLDCSYNQLTNLDIGANIDLSTIYCNTNQLMSLDASKNTKLTAIECSSQERSIIYDKAKGYFLNKYDSAFDKDKALDFVGVNLTESGELENVIIDTPFTYNYDCGSNDEKMEVKLTFIGSPSKTDKQKIDESKVLVESAIKDITITNDTTAKNILDTVTNIIALVDGVKASWKTGSPVITPATKDNEGSITGTIVLSCGSETVEITVSKVINKLSTTAIIVDKTTGVKVEYVDGTAFDSNIKLVVSPKTKEELKKYQDSVDKTITGMSIGGLYNIKLLKDGVEVQPNGKLKITLILTDSMKLMTDLQVVYIDDDGKVTIIPSQLVDGNLVFITDHFSYYGVIGKSTTINTGDTSNTMLYVGLLVLSGCLVGWGLRKKHYQK